MSLALSIARLSSTPTQTQSYPHAVQQNSLGEPAKTHAEHCRFIRLVQAHGTVSLSKRIGEVLPKKHTPVHDDGAALSTRNGSRTGLEGILRLDGMNGMKDFVEEFHLSAERVVMITSLASHHM